MGASLALAAVTLSGCRRWPEEKLVPQTSNPEGRVPGISELYATTMELGGVGLGKVGSTERALGFTGSMRAAPNKPEQEIDSEWRLIDADHYEVRSLVPTKSGQPDKPLVFTRVPAARPK